MKLSAILTIVSLYLVGLTVAAPIVESSESRIVKINGNGVKEIDLAYLFSLIDAIIHRAETDGNGSITEQDKIFIVQLILEIQNEGLMEELADELNKARLHEGFELADVDQKSSGKVSERKQSASPISPNSDTSVQEKRHEEVNLMVRGFSRTIAGLRKFEKAILGKETHSDNELNAYNLLGAVDKFGENLSEDAKEHGEYLVDGFKKFGANVADEFEKFGEYFAKYPMAKPGSWHLNIKNY